MRILYILLEELETQSGVARRLKITKNAVNGWIKEKNRHPSNENISKMLKILNDKNEKKFKEILFKELQTFQKLIFEF